MASLSEIWGQIKQAGKTYNQYVRQIPAGLAEVTIADSATAKDKAAAAKDPTRYKGVEGNALYLAEKLGLPVGYRPAILDQPAALYGVIKALTTGQVDNESTLAGRGLARSNAATERTNKALGISDPQNAAQQALRLGGSVLVPGPKFPKAATLPGKAARVVGEVALPLRQTSIPTAVAATTALGVPLREGIDALADDPSYTGLADYVKQQKAQQGDDPFAVLEADDNAADPFAALEQGDDDPFAVLEQPEAPAADLNVDNKPMSGSDKALLAAAGGLGLVLSAALGKRAVAGLRGGDTSALTGTRTVSSRAGLPARVVGAVVQADQVARRNADEFFTPDNAKRFKYNSDRMNNSSLGAKVNHAYMTGELPATAVKADPLAGVLEAIAKDLDETEFGMVTDSLLAKTALDDFNRTGVQTAFNDKTPAELKQMAKLVDQDPKLAKYDKMVRGQYSKLLDFMEQRGLISSDAAQEWRLNRPNYVHMSRDVVQEGGVDASTGGPTGNVIEEMFKRADEEWGGVQAGATRNPIDELAGRYASVIKLAEKNDHLLDFVDNMMSSKASRELVPTTDGSQVNLISKLPGTPNSAENVIRVVRDGQNEYYKVGDPALYRALQYAPRATMPVLGQMRQAAQFFTTGAGDVTGLFGATTAPVYDTLTGMVLRPAGTDIGLISEALNKIGAPGLRNLDPTAILTAPVGALRRSFDGLTGSLATNLSDQLIREHGWIYDTLGPQKTQQLRDYMQAAYDNSIRAMMDRSGTSSHMAYGADAANTVPTGLVSISPNYYSNMQKRMIQNARRGDYGAMEGLLTAGKGTFGAAKSTAIARMYTAALQNMQEGFRYQFYATNLPKVKSQADLAQLASQTRRIAVDAAQHGGSDNWNRIADSVMYSNIGTQAIAEWARKFAKQPGTTFANAATTISMLMALRYGAMFNDPEAAERSQMKTDMQNTASISTFGGMELPVEPMLRLVTGPLFALLDQVSGVADGNVDPSFKQAINNMFEEGTREEKENTEQAISDSAAAALQGANPLSTSGIPGVNAIMAANGIDPGMTRVTGEAMMQKPQGDPLAGEGTYSDSMLSTKWQKIMESLTGTGLTNIVNIADQYQRAAYARNADGSRATSPEGAVKVALSAYKDAASRQKGPASMLYKNYEKLESVADTDFKVYQAKLEGVEKAKQILDQNILRPWVTGSDPRTAMLKPIDIVPPNLVNTPLAPIGAVTADLMKQLRPLQERSGQLSRAIDTVRTGQKVTSIEDRNTQINEYNDERRYLYSLMLRAQRMAEEQISQTIGKPFTYQDFDPSAYQQPQ